MGVARFKVLIITVLLPSLKYLKKKTRLKKTGTYFLNQPPFPFKTSFPRTPFLLCPIVIYESLIKYALWNWDLEFQFYKR